MPETRGRSLESIQEAFHHPVMDSWISRLRRLVSKNYHYEGETGVATNSFEMKRHGALSATAVETRS